MVGGSQFLATIAEISKQLQNALMWGKRIYMDYAGATPVHKAALNAFLNSLPKWANPSALHQEGVEAQAVLEEARTRVSRILECKEHEIVFTSGGTEGNNLAIMGVVEGVLGNRTMSSVHVVTTQIEHASILEPIAALEKAGARVTRVAPDPFGRVTAKALSDALTPNTVLVSIGWANSEIGTVQQLGALSKVIRSYEEERHARIVFHSDAGQAPLYLPAIIAGLGVDVLTLDSGKLYGPRGVGALFIRKGVTIKPVLYGGGQEKGLRPGTENVALAQGLAAALEEVRAERQNEVERMLALRDHFLSRAEAIFPDALVNGAKDRVLPHIVNISIPGIDAEYVVLGMDKRGVAIATKSACEEGEQDSHVVKALVGPENAWRARTTLRFSFGESTTERKIDRALKMCKEVVDEIKDFARDKK